MLESYTERTSKIGFGPTRKLPRFDDSTQPAMRHIGGVGMVGTPGAAQLPIFKELWG